MINASNAYALTAQNIRNKHEKLLRGFESYIIEAGKRGDFDVTVGFNCTSEKIVNELVVSLGSKGYNVHVTDEGTIHATEGILTNVHFHISWKEACQPSFSSYEGKL